MARKTAAAQLPIPTIGKSDYAHELRRLQIELVKLHRYVIAGGHKVLIILEGRDAAGKDGTIKRIAEHLSPREVRVVAPGKPSDQEQTQWYFQRFVRHLPAAQEIVLFNRSWYNRAGVEYVMRYCTRTQRDEFLEAVPRFERMLARSGISLLKYYLDISQEEQKSRLRARRKDPLKQWKLSPVDQAAQRHWHDYSKARNKMLLRTHQDAAPWIVVRANDKRRARLNVIRDILTRVRYTNGKRKESRPDPSIARAFTEKLIHSSWLAP
jgi:polyphosphate kinase 2